MSFVISTTSDSLLFLDLKHLHGVAEASVLHLGDRAELGGRVGQCRVVHTVASKGVSVVGLVSTGHHSIRVVLQFVTSRGVPREDVVLVIVSLEDILGICDGVELQLRC